jgi:hypothetical protein
MSLFSPFFWNFCFIMTHDSRSGQRLLFSPRIMPFLCLPSLVSSGGLSFLPFLGPGCLDFHSTADKQEQERRVKPPNLTGCTPFLSFYSVSIIYYTPHTPYLPAVVSHRLQPYPPTSLLHSRQKAKNASEKSTMFLYVYIRLVFRYGSLQYAYGYHMHMSIITSTFTSTSTPQMNIIL